MKSRTIPVWQLNAIEIAMQQAPIIFHDDATKLLFDVLSSRPRTQMIKRTPLATTRRYTRYYTGESFNTYYTDKDGNKKRHKFRLDKQNMAVYRKVNPNVAGKVNMLRSSVEVGGVHTDTAGRVDFGVRANSFIPYARRVHETKKPAEGEYWQPGQRGFGHGWTTKGTGNKYVERAVRDNAKWIPETFTKQLDKRLKEAGL